LAEEEEEEPSTPRSRLAPVAAESGAEDVELAEATATEEEGDPASGVALAGTAPTDDDGDPEYENEAEAVGAPESAPTMLEELVTAAGSTAST